MKAYAIGHLWNHRNREEIAEYVSRIDGTLVPYGGRFLVHGAPVTVREGEWPGRVVVLEFPDRASANAWYDSPAYREILPLRTANVDGNVIIVSGVSDGHRATDILTA